MSSRLETLLAAVKTRLQGIQGAPNYTYTVPAANVQRWRHGWDGEERFTNILADLPAILIQTQDGEMSEAATDLAEDVIRFDLQFLLKDSANDEDKVAALADLKKALFNNFDGWGVSATLPKVSWRMIDTEGEVSIDFDGVRATVTINYQHDLGDPATRTG